MKLTELEAVVVAYGCTPERACSEILAAAGLEKRHLPCVIRKQHIPTVLIDKAKSYLARKIKQQTANIL
jgi:hypothetical protein